MSTHNSMSRDSELGTGHAAAPTAGTTADITPLGLITVLFGIFLAWTDFFIVNVALPTIESNLHASSGLLELVVAGYGTSYGVLLVLGARLGDRRGHKRLFLSGMAAFTITSLLCGLAPSAEALVAARVLQGAASAMMVPQVLSTIQATGDRVSRVRALGWFGATGGIGVVVGQVLGGLLVSANIAGTSWRPIFLVNVPVGIVAWCLARRNVPETRSSRAAQLDLPGTVLLALAVVAVLFPLTEGRALGWPVWSIAALATAPASATGFALIERRSERVGGTPMLPPSVLRYHSMRRGLLLAVPFFASFAGFMFVYALFTQDHLGWSPLVAGLAITPLAATFLCASLLMPRLVARFGRTVITAGALLQLAGLVALIGSLSAVWPKVEPADLISGIAVMGFGLGLIMSALMRVVLSEVPVEEAGAGSGALTTTQQVSLAVGVAVLGSLFVMLAPATRLGALHAVEIVLGVQALAAASIAVGSRSLDGRQRGASPKRARNCGSQPN